MHSPDALLRRMFDAMVASAQPERCVAAQLPALDTLRGGRVIVIGAGKASAAMAQAVESRWDGPLTGLVVTRHGYAAPCARIEIVEAAHPVPDEAGLRAARRMLDLVSGLRPEDTVLCLISGGGSALLPLPLDGLTLRDKQAVNRALLASGATISEMNCVRRHLSAIKGGRLAAACHPARVITLLMSDVPGDRPLDIASGPTCADPTTCADALDIAQRYGIALPEAALDALRSGRAESVKPGDPRLARAEIRMAATPQMALEAAAAVARQAGYDAHILGDALEGEARDVGKVLAGIALQAAEREQPFRPPCVLLSGGETTVTVRGQGSGGRNVECLLSLALALRDHPRIHALMADTDGVDGAEDIAGARIGPQTLARAWALGIKPAQALADNDGHGFFKALGASIVTGATRTNVNDFRAILIDAKPGDPGPTSRKPRPIFHAENLSHVPTPQPPRQDRRHAGSGQQRPRHPPQPVPCRRGRVPAELQPRQRRGSRGPHGHPARDRGRDRPPHRRDGRPARPQAARGRLRAGAGAIAARPALPPGPGPAPRQRRARLSPTRDLRRAGARRRAAAGRRPPAPARRRLRRGQRGYPGAGGRTTVRPQGRQRAGRGAADLRAHAQDLRDLDTALALGADWIALSFVQRPEDIIEARERIGDRARIIAKLEKPSAVERLDEIIAQADALMVARGDLGVELPAEQVPAIQKRAVRAAAAPASR